MKPFTTAALPLWGAAFLLTLTMKPQPAAAQTPLPNIKIVLAGDSTVAPNGGWGPGLAPLLAPSALLVNLARGGRSSKSFRDEGHWKAVLEQKPDYVFLQFGHNDQPGKGPERETDPNTTYAQNLAHYVDEARGIGAKPVLVTSLSRRTFSPQGKIQSDLTPYLRGGCKAGRGAKRRAARRFARALHRRTRRPWPRSVRRL